MKTTTPRHAQIGVPAAVLGVIASAMSASPATAVEPASTGDTHQLDATALPRAAASAPTAAATGTNLPEFHTVRPGDTVAAIAASFGLATADVLAWNDLSWRSVIYPGQTIRLTSHSPSASPAPKSATTGTHTVVAGDTVFAIAENHGTSVAAILAANSLTPASIIYPGQILRIAPPAPSADAAPAASAAPDTTAALNASQAENAALIIRIGRELGVPERGIAIALSTSMVESWMRNLDWGDRDSLGLFQQRPSTGWGDPSQIMDRGHSIRSFFLGAHNADGTTTRGLLDIPGWQEMPFSDAAQAVQISAYPERYGLWEQAAYRWLELYG